MFFRYNVLHDFGRSFGDRYDGVIEVSLLEHWLNFVLGYTSWSQTFFLFPYKDTLGYNDGYFLYGIVYSLFRLLGLDPFLSGDCVDIVVKCCGFTGFYIFMRWVFKTSAICASLGAAIFPASNNSYIQGSHEQLFTVGRAPILAAVLYRLIIAVSKRDERQVTLWGCTAAVFFASWLVTAFYTAWFFLAYCSVALLLIAVFFGRGHTQNGFRNTAACWKSLSLVTALLIVGLMPFVALYEPKATETGMHGFQETSLYLLQPLDLFNLGGNNLFYHSLQGLLRPYFSRQPENSTGFTPELVVVFLATSVWAIWKRSDDRLTFAACMSVATVAMWILAVSWAGHSLWTVVYTYVPGAQAVRVVSRLQLLLAWPVVTIAALGLDDVASSLGRAWVQLRLIGPLVAAAIGVPMLIAQYNAFVVPDLDRTAEMQWLKSIDQPPQECESFFVSEPRPPEERYGQALNKLVSHDIDSMLLSELLKKPTINGFASLLPPEWNLLSIDHPDYIDRVKAYAVRNTISHLCGVNLATGRWDAKPF